MESQSHTDSMHDAMLTEVRGLTNAVATRMEGFEREQDLIREWLARLTTSVDRVSETLTRLMGHDVRLGVNEASITDLELDMATVQADIQSIKESRTKTQYAVNAIVGFLSAGASALLIKLVGG